MTITIKTRLHDGIYKSSGGGETRTHYEWTTGPRNLLKAIDTLHEHRASMERGYGNIGHQGSWIEVDGVPVRLEDIQDMHQETSREYRDPDSRLPQKSRTQWAREFIASVKDGSLVANRREVDAYINQMCDEEAAKHSI